MILEGQVLHRRFGNGSRVGRLGTKGRGNNSAIGTRRGCNRCSHFLCKHFRAMTKVEQDLRRAALSERRFEFTDSKPIDMQQMPLEHQCLLEVLQEQSEKANEAAVANGTPHDVSYTVTTGMVESKMKENWHSPSNLTSRCSSRTGQLPDDATRRLIPAGVCAEQRRQIKWTKDLRQLGVDELRAALADNLTRP